MTNLSSVPNLLPLCVWISSLEAYTQFQIEAMDYINNMIVRTNTLHGHDLDGLLVEDISGPPRIQMIHL